MTRGRPTGGRLLAKKRGVAEEVGHLNTKKPRKHLRGFSYALLRLLRALQNIATVAKM